MTRLQKACRNALCGLIRAYQYTLSPWIGRSCRFTPSCSNYTMQAIQEHGCLKGILLGGMAHRPVQSPRQMGLRPGAGAGPLAEPCPPPAACKAV